MAIILEKEIYFLIISLQVVHEERQAPTGLNLLQDRVVTQQRLNCGLQQDHSTGRELWMESER